jgi:hypothetical protein
MRHIIFTSLFLTVTLIPMTVNSQNLFGNHSCISWLKLPLTEKTTWLNAFLVPLNLTNVSRKKPKEDKFSKLATLEPAVLYVDFFCEANSDEFAAKGAVQFLDDLTSEPQPK